MMIFKCYNLGMRKVWKVSLNDGKSRVSIKMKWRLSHLAWLAKLRRAGLWRALDSVALPPVSM